MFNLFYRAYLHILHAFTCMHEMSYKTYSFLHTDSQTLPVLHENSK